MTEPTARASSAPTVARLLVELVGFWVLLFLSRFVAQADLVHHLDEECHVGGIAVDVLANGIRFPLATYAPSAYNNGAFFGGLLTAAFFSLFGRNVLVLKMVSHTIVAAGAVATLELLRGCFAELEIVTHRARWTAVAVLVVATAFAPRVVTTVSMGSMGFGGPAEGSAIGAVLLALFAYRLRTRPAAIGTAIASWTLLGTAVYLNRALALLAPVLATAELAVLGWRRGLSVAVPLLGFVVGDFADVLTAFEHGTTGWADLGSKVQEKLHSFPYAFLESVRIFASGRFALVLAWGLAVGFGIALVLRSARTRIGPPIALGIVTGSACVHIAVLTVMAHGGIDHYIVYGYLALVVLLAILAAQICTSATLRWRGRLANPVCVAVLAIAFVLHRPAAWNWDFRVASRLWHNQAGAACSWRFAEGFEREQTAASESREEHALQRCRTLSGQDQVLDCVGGIARQMSFVDGAMQRQAPPGLTAAELRAFAFYYGARRFGDPTRCADFSDTQLQRDCVGAVDLACLVYADINTLFFAGHPLSRPRCTLREPPFDGYWTALRADFLARPNGKGPYLGRPPLTPNDVDVLASCQSVFDACY